MECHVMPGRSFPLGVTLGRGGANFSLYSRSASEAAFDSPNDIGEWRTSPAVPGRIYRAAPRSVVVLFSAVD